MGFLRGLGTAVCSIVLFLALSVFSIAFLLNSTVLSADFVNSQIDKIDMSAIAGDVIADQINEELPPGTAFLKDAALSIIESQEPLVKEQLHAGISGAYDYFLHEESTFAITISLVEIKQNIKDSLWQTAIDYLAEQLSGLSDADASRYLQDIIGQIPEELLPVELALLPEAQRNEVIEQYLRELTGYGSLSAMPLGLDIILESQVKVYFERYFDEYVREIPDTYVIDESSISPETLEIFRDARKYVSYFQTAYLWLMVLMIVIAGLIFLINWRNVKASVRALGIDLLVFGFLHVAGVLFLRYFPVRQVVPDYSDIPVSMQNWVEGLFKDVTGIMLWFGVGVLVSGVILTVVSFFIRRPEAVRQSDGV